MEKEITYSSAGVDRNLRAQSKSKVRFDDTYKHVEKVLKLPYNTIYYNNGIYHDHVIEGIGTKVLIAQLAKKFDTIGIDAVAMAVNDVIRSGAKPISLTDNIDLGKSDPKLIDELLKGVMEGARQAEVAVTGGEIADVKELISGISDNPFHIVCSCIGDVEEKNIVWGSKLEVGDEIIGLRSSGPHSNGISLARRVLFKKWGGRFDPFDKPDGFDREIVYECLEPTKIYVKPLLSLLKEFKIKAAVHITGDAYSKFDKLVKFNPKIGLEFDNFKPHSVFQLIQDSAKEMGRKITDEEMLRTFNMGWGFAIIGGKNNNDSIISKLKKSGVEAELIGKVTDTKSIVANYNKKKMVLNNS